MVIAIQGFCFDAEGIATANSGKFFFIFLIFFLISPICHEFDWMKCAVKSSIDSACI